MGEGFGEDAGGRAHEGAEVCVEPGAGDAAGVEEGCGGGGFLVEEGCEDVFGEDGWRDAGRGEGSCLEAGLTEDAAGAGGEAEGEGLAGGIGRKEGAEGGVELGGGDAGGAEGAGWEGGWVAEEAEEEVAGAELGVTEGGCAGVSCAQTGLRGGGEGHGEKSFR